MELLAEINVLVEISSSVGAKYYCKYSSHNEQAP